MGLTLASLDKGYKVDSYASTTLLLVDTIPNQFASIDLTSGTNLSYTVTDLTFELQFSDPIPADGILQIWIPPEVTVNSALQCIGISGVRVGRLTCSLLTQGTDLYVLLSNPFQGAVDPSVPAKF